MVVEILLPKNTFELTKYRLAQPVELVGVQVPKGFVTDGASVPRFLWWLFPPVGRYFTSAVIHDYLLVTGHHWRHANRKFKQALEEQGVAKWVVYSMYYAVQSYQFVKHEVMGRARKN